MTNRVVTVGKLMELINNVYRGHKEHKTNCKGELRWDFDTERSRGLSCNVRLLCAKCNYQSKHHKLYTEAKRTGKRGPRKNLINESIQVAINQCPIGPTSVQRIIASANIKPPSRTLLQDKAKIVSDKIKNINTNDMKDIRSKLKDINRYRGNPIHEVDLEVDSVYNNPLNFASGQTPLQPATQCVTVAVENTTHRKSLIGMTLKNKNCTVRPPCVGEHVKKCKGNLPLGSSIGNEKAWAQELLSELVDDGIHVRNLVTDTDTGGFKAAEHLYECGRSSVKPKHHFDTTHLSRNQRKTLKKRDKLLDIMPGRTKKIRIQQRGRFAQDITNRCQAEMHHIYKVAIGDKQKLTKLSQNACNSIIKCYQGNHRACRTKSFVCSGNWIKNSTYLDDDFEVKQIKETTDILKECVGLRLNDSIIEKTMYALNTQKVESGKRRIKKSLPVSQTFTRNFEGRAHSAAHRINHGPAKSIEILCRKIGAPLAAPSSVSKFLEEDHRRYTLNKQRANCKNEKIKKAKKRDHLYKLYDSKVDEEIYVSNRLMRGFKACQ